MRDFAAEERTQAHVTIAVVAMLCVLLGVVVFHGTRCSVDETRAQEQTRQLCLDHGFEPERCMGGRSR